MGLKITSKKNRVILIYLLILIILFVIVEILPKVSDAFATTEVLEVGNLALTCETTGYLVKDEYICIADESGEITYKQDVGTVVKKGHKLCKVKTDSTKTNSDSRFKEYTDRLGSYKCVTSSYKAPISGVYSLTMDGYEGIFTFDNMAKLEKTAVESYKIKDANLERSAIIKGEPVYKVSGDDEWYVLCWMDQTDADKFREGEKVTLQLPKGDVTAKVYLKKSEGNDVKVIFSLDVYYENFTKERCVPMTVVASADEGLIVKNKCIVEKNGQPGVYVVDKNGAASFVRVKIVSTDKENSVLKDTSFYDENGNQVFTVNVYDKVLNNPDSALKKDLEKESSGSQKEAK